MQRFSRLFLFPDVNVWVALTYGGHIHHPVAKAWFDQLEGESRVCFCRFTQLSLLRLLTTEAVMGDERMTQNQAWAAYDMWLSDGRVIFLEESPDVEPIFRSLSNRGYPSPKTWSDDYLAAFAAVSDLHLVTFDQGFRGRLDRLLILRPE
jgi:toxin-antitoxin system PIN domain toxin